MELKVSEFHKRRGEKNRSFELVRIPGGEIISPGADGKPVKHILKPFWIARHETRITEYEVYAFAYDLDVPNDRHGDLLNDLWRRRERPAKPEYNPDGGFGRDGYPIGCASFLAATDYCKWLTKQTGKKFRLPTEAEWKYACRAGGPAKPDPKVVDRVAWTKENAKDVPHPVGQREPNAWGLYDMLGNVAEYVVSAEPQRREEKPADVHERTAYRLPPDRNLKAVIAGGSYKVPVAETHAGWREAYSRKWHGVDPQEPPDAYWYWETWHIGFRVVMEE